ncbi:MAG TPA: phytoene/squalene synthase family protein, partial [Candidatus Limnocylindrales bacterium]|nr:phytoene/squalene synthase family protein [Candidatus Limnocylindrales bacterium]
AMTAPVERHDGEARVVMARVARTFDLATRLLPADARTDVRRLYLVLRTLDDLVDGGDPDAGARLAAVEAWVAGEPATGLEAELLTDLAARHPALPRDAVADFCAGMRADLRGPCHATDDDLDTYCYQVAGTVGRLMAPLLGIVPGRDAEADTAARALGAAMQRTNILRDLREDARHGRVYLPASALAGVGVAPGDAGALLDLPAWPRERRERLLAPEIARAEADYASGLAGIDSLARGRPGIRAAGGMYRAILREIERDGYGASGRRAVVPRHRKVRLVAAALTRGRDGDHRPS